MLQEIILLSLSCASAFFAATTFVFFMKNNKVRAHRHFQFLAIVAAAWTLYDFSYANYPMAFYELAGVCVMGGIISYRRFRFASKEIEQN